MIKLKMSGFDELERNLRELGRRAENLNGPVRFDELFSPEFIRRYTDFTTLDELVNASGFKVESIEDFEQIPEAEWDAFIAAKTRFSGWEKMKAKAVEEYASRRLGFNS